MSQTEVEAPKWVGKSIRRREDPRLLRGRGQFLADITPPGTAYVHLVRSTHAHARIRVDTSKAESLPGVVAVVTGAEVAAAVKPLLIPTLVPTVGGELKVPLAYPLVVDKVVCVGDLIAAVVAESKYIAEDAAALVEVEYEPLPLIEDPEEALKPDAPRVYEDWADNALWHGAFAAGDVDGAFAQADYVFKERFSCHRTGAAPIETRGIIASYDEFNGLTVHMTTQRPHITRIVLADVMGVPHEKIRVIAPKDVGGAFGTKGAVYREDILIPYLAMRLKRPVKWIETRTESLMVNGQERNQIHYLELAVRKDGKVLGLRDRIVADSGDGRSGIYMGFLMPWLGMFYLSNAYDIPNQSVELTCAVTNKPCLTPSRAFGEFPVRFAMDYALHLVARELKLDPRQVFEVNLIRQFPYSTPFGISHDSGDYAGAFQTLLAELEYDKVKQEQAEARKQGRYIGVGFSLGCEMSGVSSAVFVPMEGQPGYGSATVKIDARGRVLVAEGDSPQGQGHETAISQIVADELGVPIDDISLTYGDTATSPFGSGTLGNRGASYTFNAVVVACRKLKPKLAAIAAHLMEVEAGPDDLVFADGEVSLAADPTKRVKLTAIADAAIMAPTKLPPGVEPGLDATGYFEPNIVGLLSFTAQGAVVEVDPESGDYKILRYLVVDDAGRPINPMLVEGQVQGGVAMGIGNTRYEQYVYDENGQPLSTTLMEYHIPSAADVPEIEVIDRSVPSPFTPLGSKGKGEGVPGPVPAALASAVTDAIGRPGFKLTSLPLTPEAVWRAMQQA